MPWLVTQKGVMAVSAIDCYGSAMPQVSHCAVMQVPFMSMAIRPNPLLSKRAIGTVSYTHLTLPTILLV